MILHNGTIFDKQVLADGIVSKQVSTYHRYVGIVAGFDPRTGIATVSVGGAVVNVHISNLTQIWIMTRERINDLQPDVTGVTTRLLRLDQWEYALENYVMTGEDNVQFGWWKENESDHETFFQLPSLGSLNRFDKDYAAIAKLARKKNMFGDYLYDTPDEVVEAYFDNINNIKNKDNKKKR